MKKGEFNGLQGCRGELLVAADMMRQGWRMYRALSGSDECDLIGRKGGQVVLVSVKSEVGRAGIRRCHVLAVVNPATGLIRYRVINRRIARLFEECKIIRTVRK